MKNSIKIILITLLIILIALFLIRLTNPTEIDDISPGIPCPELEIYNPDILWVIPLHNGKPISQNQEWCQYILSLNKTLGMHGITHTYQEFELNNILQEELNSGIQEFQECFNQTPQMFKPPYLRINKQNKKLIKQNNLKLKYRFNQWMHKVYHCNDFGRIPNKLISLF